MRLFKGLANREITQLGRSLHERPGNFLAYFDVGVSNGPVEAINGRLQHLRGIALGFCTSTTTSCNVSSAPDNSPTKSTHSKTGRDFKVDPSNLTTAMQYWRKHTETFILHNYLPRMAPQGPDAVRNELNGWLRTLPPGGALHTIDIWEATVDPPRIL